MKMSPWRWLICSVLTLSAIASSGLAVAQDQSRWPNRPVKIIVPFAPGAFLDNCARLVAKELSDQLGQSFVVENKLGASGAIGADFVAKSPADGYTLLLMDASFAMLPAVKNKLPYDPAKDFALTGMITELPALLMARPNITANSLGDVISLAKKNPGKLTFASSGLGSSTHLPMAHILSLTGTNLVHVPFKGAGVSMPEVMADRIDLVMVAVPTGLPHVRSGRLRALAVSGSQRDASLPEVPTFAEAGLPGFNMTFWFSLAAPAKTPQAIVDLLEREVAKAVQSPRLRAAFAAQSAAATFKSAADVTKLLQAQIVLWKDIAIEAKVKPED